MADHLRNGNPQIQQQPNLSDQHLQSFQPDPSSHDDFLQQMLSALPNLSWPPDLSNPNPNPNPLLHSIKPLEQHSDVNTLPLSKLPLPFPNSFEDLSSKLRNHVNGGANSSSSMTAAAKSLLLSNSAVTPSDGSVQALYNGFPNQQPFQAGAMVAMKHSPVSGSTGGSGGQAPQRQRIRARRGQATDPHSIAERLRRERIAERMKALQELVPNANKTDKASMLDEIIDYVKFLQLQVKVLSMSRLGGAAAHPSSQGGGRNPVVEGMSITEQQVIKLMEDDMGSAMQYLQSKGLCLMPISLATAISTATCRPPTIANRNNLISTSTANGNAPSSPSVSGLTVQSLLNGDGFVKDPNPPPQG